jgi:hypothetical protein
MTQYRLSREILEFKELSPEITPVIHELFYPYFNNFNLRKAVYYSPMDVF